MEWIVSFSAVMVTAALGVLSYTNTKKKQQTDDGSILIGDALKIKEAYQEMYAELEERVERLSNEVDLAIRKGEMWRGVARDAAIAHQQRFGSVPKWWPSDEPLPEVV